MTAQEFILKKQDDIDSLANSILDMAIANDCGPRGDGESCATIITLQGELGSGKTTFTKAFAKRLGITESVTSPTFVILRRYPIPESAGIPFANLIHVDAYRVEKSSEMEKIGFQNFIKTSSEKNILCIEWPEIISDILPSSRIEMKFSHIHGPKHGLVHSAPEHAESRKVTVELKV